MDCTRGICSEDLELMDQLEDIGRQYHVVLTKCDILTPKELARCNWLVSETVANRPNCTVASDGQSCVSMISARHWQGIEHFFDTEILFATDTSS